MEQEQTPVKKYEITATLLADIMNYLVRQPYGQVTFMLDELHKQTSIKLVRKEDVSTPVQHEDKQGED